MLHFVVEIIYKAPIEKINEVVDSHRTFLQEGYDKGMLLMSGPQMPKIGGVVIARAESMEELSVYFENDPYNKAGLTEYKYIQFNPVKHSEIVQNWVK